MRTLVSITLFIVALIIAKPGAQPRPHQKNTLAGILKRLAVCRADGAYGAPGDPATRGLVSPI
jgi:hypothetical protein